MFDNCQLVFKLSIHLLTSQYTVTMIIKTSHINKFKQISFEEADVVHYDSDLDHLLIFEDNNRCSDNPDEWWTLM